MLINPSHYNCTDAEIIEIANNLALSPEVVRQPLFKKIFYKSTPCNKKSETQIRLHPHGQTADERTHSLMLFFHFLGRSKRILNISNNQNN